MAKRKGFTLVSLLISTVVGAIALGLAARAYFSATKLSQRMYERSVLESTVSELMLDLLRVGRLATASPPGRGCLIIGSGIECDVDYNNPPTSVVTRVRFVKQDETVRFEQFRGGEWKLARAYEKIQSFDFCSDAEFQAQTCTLEPLKISQERRLAINEAGAKDSASDRFFRVRVTGGTERDAFHQQSSFYVRNPPLGYDNPATLSGRVRYQWGVRD